jgi:hypothetical protein
VDAGVGLRWASRFDDREDIKEMTAKTFISNNRMLKWTKTIRTSITGHLP